MGAGVAACRNDPVLSGVIVSEEIGVKASAEPALASVSSSSNRKQENLIGDWQLYFWCWFNRFIYGFKLFDIIFFLSTYCIL